MDENLHNIDDLFKKALDEHEETPSDNVWEKIDKNLDKKKVVFILEKYNKLKWIAAALLIFSTGLAMYTLGTKMRDTEVVRKNIAVSRKEVRKSVFKNNDDNEINSDNRPTTDPKKEVTINSTLKPEVDNKIDTSVAIKTGIEAEVDFNKKTGNRYQKKLSRKSKEDLAKNEFNQFERYEEKKGKEVQIVEEHLTDNERETIENNAEERTKNHNSFLFNKKVNHALDKSFETASENRFRKVDLSTELQNNLQLNSSNNTLQKVLADQGETPGIVLPNRLNVKFKANPARKASFSATAFYSRDFVSSKVDNDHHRFREEDRNEIKNKEEIKNSYTTGILINYYTGKKLSIESGLTFSSMTTAIAPKQIYARQDDRGNINFKFNCSAGYSYIPPKAGSNLAVGDSIPAFSSKNILQYIGVPVAVGYNIIKGRFSLSPGIGITLNLLAKGKIETAIPGISGPQKTSLDHIEGLTRSYLNGSLRFGVNYNVSQKVAFSFTPTAKVALTSINKNAPVKTYLNSLAIGAGVLVRL